LAFAIADTGIGIPWEKHARIFEPFTQEDTSTTRRYGGTGLGLTIAARLAALMNGKIDLASEPGRGRTITFVAPFPPAAHVAALRRAAHVAAHTSAEHVASHTSAEHVAAHTSAAHVAPHVPSPALHPHERAAPLGVKSVLVAEDNAFNAMLITERLRRRGHRV